MILVVGSGSWLVKKIAPILASDEDLLLVGRTDPTLGFKSHNGTTKEISHIPSDYKDVEPILDACKSSTNITIIFAGVGITPALLARSKQDKLEEEVKSHILFPMRLCAGVLPKMVSNRFGRFIFFGSSEGSRGLVGGAMYTTVKSAQKGLSRSIAIEYGRFGVTSNVIDLGYLGGGQARNLTPDVRDAFEKKTRFHPTVTPGDIALTIRALIQNPGLTGSVVTLDGAS